jgi:chorismate mutase
MSQQSDSKLREYRESIDNIDAALIFLLSERFKITKKVGHYKKTHDLPPADKARESEQVRRMRDLAKAAKLDPDFSEKFISFVIQEVIRNHEQIRRS